MRQTISTSTDKQVVPTYVFQTLTKPTYQPLPRLTHRDPWAASMDAIFAILIITMFVQKITQRATQTDWRSP